MENYFKGKGHTINSTKLFHDEKLPSTEEFDWLIVMGGPMGVYDYTEYSWLEREKDFIKSVIDVRKIVLGICFGAQLIADCLGAKIKKNKFKEIGWFPIFKTDLVDKTILVDVFPSSIDAFHWHGDTFDLPPEATLLASSEACRNQAFSIANQIFGFQFHLETTLESAKLLIENCSEDLDSSDFVQTSDEILSDVNRFNRINKVMDSVLRQIEVCNG